MKGPGRAQVKNRAREKASGSRGDGGWGGRGEREGKLRRVSKNEGSG